MSTDWKDVAIDSLCQAVLSGGTPRTAELANYQGGTIPWVTTTEVNYNRIFDTKKMITERGVASSAAAFVPKDTVIVAMYGRGTAGRVAMAGLPLTTNQACCNLVVDANLADPRFLYYALSYSFDRLDALTNGSVQQNLSVRLIKDFHLRVPPLAHQTAIANILGAFDDKIELNRRMSETLDEIARLLFRSIFEDKSALRHQEAPVIERHHPSGYIDEVQEPSSSPSATWRISDLADVNPESWSRRNAPASVEYVDLSATRWGTINSTTKYDWDAAPSRARRILRAGDTIVGMVRPANGAFALVGRSGLTGSTGFTVLRPKRPHYRELIYLAATSGENIEHLGHLADGGAYPAVRPEQIADTRLLQRPEVVLERFSRSCAPMFDRLHALRSESETLADLRDTMLPKLVSGDLRIPDAERLVSEAV